MIDLDATRKKIKSTGRTLTGWARLHGYDTLGIHARFRGQVRFNAEEIEALRADGFLVEKEAA